MVDEGTVGAIQVDDRDLSHRFIHPDLGVVTGGGCILHDNVIRAGAPNGCLSPPLVHTVGDNYPEHER